MVYSRASTIAAVLDLEDLTVSVSTLVAQGSHMHPRDILRTGYGPWISYGHPMGNCTSRGLSFKVKEGDTPFTSTGLASMVAGLFDL